MLYLQYTSAQSKNLDKLEAQLSQNYPIKFVAELGNYPSIRYWQVETDRTTLEDWLSDFVRTISLNDQVIVLEEDEFKFPVLSDGTPYDYYLSLTGDNEVNREVLDLFLNNGVDNTQGQTEYCVLASRYMIYSDTIEMQLKVTPFDEVEFKPDYDTIQLDLYGEINKIVFDSQCVYLLSSIEGKKVYGVGGKLIEPIFASPEAQ